MACDRAVLYSGWPDNSKFGVLISEGGGVYPSSSTPRQKGFKLQYAAITVELTRTRGRGCDDKDSAITSKRPERCGRCCQHRVLRPRLRARARTNEARSWQPCGCATVRHRLSAAARHQ